jgi:S-disulfanyl-L-cysteine oxidoreductase SoxD
MQGKIESDGQPMNVVQAVRRWATAAVAGVAISSIPLSGVIAQTVSSYTQAQADRGHKAYDGYCAGCHGPTLGGTGDIPALAGVGFRMHWFVGSPAPFVAFIMANMPQDNPGSLDPKTYADIAAYLMSKNHVPAGGGELAADPDALANVTIPPLQ